MPESNFYLGPYLVIVKDIVNGLEQDKVPNWEALYYKGNFCDYLYSTSFMGPPEIVNNKRRYIYLPNRHILEIGCITIDGSYEFDEIVNYESIRDSLDIFKNRFSDEIKYVHTLFDNIEINFGVVSYHS